MFGQLSQPAEAVQTLERILAINPGSCDAHQRLTFYYAITLQRMKTAAETRRTIEIGCDLPETYVYLMGADWLILANTESVNTRWLTENPGTELFSVAAIRGEIANRGLEDSLEDEATAAEGSTSELAQSREDQLLALFAKYPDNLEALSYFLQTSQISGDVEEVTKLLASAPPAALDDNRFWRFKAWVHGTRNELAEADAAYVKARDLFPFDAVAMHEQAVIQRKLGNDAEAARLADLADRGRTLRRTILQQPSVQATSPETMVEIADFIADCGETDVATKLRTRIQQMVTAGQGPLP
jgi:tetratricopeptide (TPR) repeat protein